MRVCAHFLRLPPPLLLVVVVLIASADAQYREFFVLAVREQFVCKR